MHARMFLPLSLLPALLLAQSIPPTRPEIRGIFPHGGERGTDFEITIRGANLQNSSAIRFATPKMNAELLRVEHNSIKARVHLDPTAEPGRHDLRLIAPHGSTIGWFEVGTRTESFEKEPNNDRAHAQPIEFPALMNGTIRPGDYDYFKFTARAGETITFDVAAKRFESALDSVLSLLDEKGTELAYIDDYYWFKDPHLVHKFEKAGVYFLRIFGTGESGSENGDYRLTAGEMPQVDHAMPVGAQRGKTQEIQLSGVNLSTVENAVLGEGITTATIVSKSDRTATLRITIPRDAPLGLHQLHVDGATLPVPFVISDLPQVTVTSQSAGRKQDAYPVTLPVVANGVIDRPNGGHYFNFRVDEQQDVLLAVDALRLDVHLDPIVVLYDESGKRIAYQDDPTPTNSAKRPANVDPHLVVNLKPGRYTAFVRDNAFRGDPTYSYRFTMKRAEPDYSAAIVGSDETLFRGKETIVTIRVRRLEGWNTPVEVWAENLPEGVTGPSKVTVPIEPTHFKGTCAEDNILDGTEVDFPLKVAANAPFSVSKITFRAKGVMGERTVERPVAANYWWRNLQKIWGPAETPELYATVIDPPEMVLDVPDRVAAPGGKGTVKVVITRLDDGKAALELHAVNPPAGVVVESVTIPAGGTLADVKVIASTAAPVTIVLEGATAGKVLGKSHPILIDTAARAAAAQVTSDEN